MEAPSQKLPHAMGRYEIKDLLGRGGMGRVLLGWDPKLHREVAIKLVETAEVPMDQLAEARFMFHRQARAVARLDHANIIKVLDYSGADAAQMFLVTEVLRGDHLQTHLEKYQAFSLRTACCIAYEIAQALGHAHQKNIVHRDIKPENIFWTDDGRIAVTDFGIAKAFDDVEALGHTIQFGQTRLFGSPRYIAPEQLKDEEATPTTDLYALGTVFYEMLSGQAAIEGENIAVMLDNVVAGKMAPIDHWVSVPSKVKNLVESLLATDPHQRPQSAEAVSNTLRDILDDLEVSDPRRYLRHAQEPVPLDSDDSDSTLLFEAQIPDAIRIPAAIKHKRSTLLSKGPVVIGMLAMAIALAMSVHFFKGLSDEALVKQSAEIQAEQLGDVPIALEGAKEDADIAAEEEVYVRVFLGRRGSLSVDGKKMGAWQGKRSFFMPAGRHLLVAKSEAETQSKEVLILIGTEPNIEFFKTP